MTVALGVVKVMHYSTPFLYLIWYPPHTSLLLLFALSTNWLDLVYQALVIRDEKWRLFRACYPPFLCQENRTEVEGNGDEIKQVYGTNMYFDIVLLRVETFHSILAFFLAIHLYKSLTFLYIGESFTQRSFYRLYC